MIMPDITLGNTHKSGVIKPHLVACGVIKTIPNNHTSHVTYDTKTRAYDTGTVDLEKSYWNKWEEYIVKQVITYYSRRFFSRKPLVFAMISVFHGHQTYTCVTIVSSLTYYYCARLFLFTILKLPESHPVASKAE